MALALRFYDAFAMVDALEHDVPGHADAEAERIRWECAAICAVVCVVQDDPQRALAMAQTCLARPSSDAWTTNVLSNVVRLGYWKAGRLEALYATSWIPDSIEDDKRNVFSSVYRLCLLGH